MRPLILLDVDGPLNPWAASAPPPGFSEYTWPLRRWSRRRQRAWLNPAHGPLLLDLAARLDAELVWASSWEDRANITVGPVLGLPLLRVIGLRAYEEHHAGKYAAVGRFAAHRPLAWLDDDFALYASAREEFLARRRETTMLVHVDPATGITTQHLTEIEQTLSSHP